MDINNEFKYEKNKQHDKLCIKQFETSFFFFFRLELIFMKKSIKKRT